MYSLENVLDSNEKKITNLLKINENTNCLSKYEKLRIESLVDEEELNIEEWSKIRDYLSFLFHSTILLHEIESIFYFNLTLRYTIQS